MDAAGYKVGELLMLSSISRHTCIQGENISSHGKFSRKYGTQIWMFLLFPGWHYISQLHYIRVCLYNPRYIMYITLLSFGVWQRLFEGGYYYAHLGAACGGYMSVVKFEVQREFEEIWYILYNLLWILQLFNLIWLMFNCLAMLPHHINKIVSLLNCLMKLLKRVSVCFIQFAYDTN